MTPTDPAVAAPKGLMTADQFFDYVQRPENENKWLELVRGEVIELPSPTKIHGTVCNNIAVELTLHARRRRKGYVATNDSGVILERDPDTVRGPDVGLYEDAERFRELHPKYGEAPPVLAVEVLSPSDTFKRIDKKIKQYPHSGIKVVWIVDLEERTISVYRAGGEWHTITADQKLTGDPELPGFQCRVADLFLLPAELNPEPPAA
jgi:Uma2 family endonuclease